MPESTLRKLQESFSTSGKYAIRTMSLLGKELETAFDPKKLEGKVREYWKAIDLKALIKKEVSGNRPIGYVEGPPTLNGEPHMGHIRGRIMKDVWYRFSTLKEVNIVYRAGWDTQGLPVELQAEKELGLSGSKAENIRKVGEEAIVNACKSLIGRYYKSWLESDELLGMLMDYEKAYWTYKDEYIEREWKYLQKAWERGLLAEGFRVVAYCPSCQTSLSHKEVGLGYETVEDPSLYYKVKLVDEDAFLLVWTTMPFTVVTDEMIGVKPDSEYAYVKVEGETWVIAKDRVDEMTQMLRIEEHKISKVVKGAELEGKRYVHPLAKKYIPSLAKLAEEGKVHIVVAEEWVDITAGTGLVHLSPANGEEDYQVALRRNVPVFSPIDDQAKFTKDAGRFAGLFVRDADDEVAKLLEGEGMSLRFSTIKHEYPLCWRSHHKLVWLARREYFYWVDRLGDLAVEAAQKVEYFYEPPKNRFIEIIKEKVPWCISRERVWGTPLPVWVCTKCGEKTVVFSRKDIISRAVELPDGENFELHRPWIDRIILKCEKCGANAKREPFVLDTWHNSGAAPYAAFTDEDYKELVPVMFLTEGIDQTRGWAYTLLIENVIMTGKAEAPYKAFLFQGHVLDEKGNKMSKSLGNVIEGITTLKENPVDLVRFYMMWKASPLDGLSFSHAEMKARAFQVISTLYHLHKYFQQNSKYDNYDVRKHTLEWAEGKKLLKPSEYYLLLKLENLKEVVAKGYETCRFQESASAIDSFVIGTLSQSYLPMIRGELWDDREETLDRRLAIYALLAHALQTVDILVHPISPYLTEALYVQTFSPEKQSILLSKWPASKPELRNEKLEEVFLALDTIISVANAARMKAKVKRRWPMKSATVLVPAGLMKEIQQQIELLKEMTNVKQITLTDSIDGTPIKLRLKPRYDLLGPIFKAAISKARKHFEALDPMQVKEALDSKEFFALTIDGQEFKVSRKEIEFEYVSNDRHAVADREGYIVALTIERDADLVAEGTMRDIARRLQALRKERGYSPTDILDAAYLAGLEPELADIVVKKKSELAFLVRVKKVEVMAEDAEGIKWSETELDGKAFKISVQ